MSIVDFSYNVHDNEFWTRAKLRQFCSRSLAANIIAFRTLNLNKKISIHSMEELYYRKYIGDDFNYDAFINKEMNKMPEIKNNNMNFGLIKNIVDKNILDILNTKGF